MKGYKMITTKLVGVGSVLLTAALLSAGCGTDDTRPQSSPSQHEAPASEDLAKTEDALASPSFIYPSNGQTLTCSGSYLFKVNSVPNATGYLWGFFQNGVLLYQEFVPFASGYEYAITAGTSQHSTFYPQNCRATDVWVRAAVNGQWTDPASIITINLR